MHVVIFMILFMFVFMRYDTIRDFKAKIHKIRFPLGREGERQGRGHPNILA